MSDNKNDDSQTGHVIDFAAGRRRQEKTKKDANKRMNGASAEGGAKITSKAWTWVQLIVLLAVVAYMMQLCRA